ncbi:HD domain-containing phosphohydrolase [Paenibacillus turpanensis]|uniref:HD domain-containing phosphohydrolase n=1 Tax=Paenibacillus turpanensis TaxID=2689078 RepID=UPI00140CA873|nr:HD domain-containing phosphohydrolase [Paenibacillus turpanensis]
MTGQWELYWQQLIDPYGFRQHQGELTRFTTQPKLWNDEEGLNNVGYATMRLHLFFHESDLGKQFALSFPRIFGASQIWIGGEYKISNGVVGLYKHQVKPLERMDTILFTPTRPYVEVVVQASNFHHRKGGIDGAVKLGLEPDIQSITLKQMLIEVIVAGGVLLSAIYHLLLYIMRRADYSHLYFSLFSFCIVVTVSFTGTKPINLVTEMLSYQLGYKLEYIHLFGSALFLFLFYNEMYPSRIHRSALRVLKWLTAASIILILATPVSLFGFLAFLFYAILISFSVYLMIQLLRSYIQGESHGLITFITLAIFFATFIHDIFTKNFYFQSYELHLTGVASIVLGQSLILAFRFSQMHSKVESLLLEVNENQKEIIFTLSEVAEKRSQETGYHVKRVAEYSKLLALKYGLPEKEAETVRLASSMHDIGKLAIPDTILNKPGKLTTEEYSLMQTHVLEGYGMLKHSNREVMKAAATIALTHHEKYDGTGYPKQLKGKDIPLYGRIVAVADVFDALGSDRVYKQAWGLQQIIDYFEEQKGRHFDPELVDLFLRHLSDFLAIRDRYIDTLQGEFEMRRSRPLERKA